MSRPSKFGAMVDAVCDKLDDEGMDLFRRVVLEVAEDAAKTQRRHTRKAIHADLLTTLRYLGIVEEEKFDTTKLPW